MRTKSYLDKEPQNINDYSKKNTYISADELNLSKKYTLLPEEYDMFSELDQELFTNNDTKQMAFISLCLRYMKECLIEFYNNNDVVCILPKLICSHDNEGTITFSMALSNFRAFMSFEGKQGNYDAYYGVVSQLEEDSFSSETKKLTIDNYEPAILSLLQIIINNS